jgi:hypothetical protein
MTGINQYLDRIEINLKNDVTGNLLPVYIDVFDSSLSRKWLAALNQLITDNYHLEKNYCFFGFPDSPRNGPYLINQINASISAINQADLGYYIDDYLSYNDCIDADLNLVHERTNLLHRYFEDLQGVSGQMSPYYNQADDITRWHIRQLNLLCHEFESWVLSWKKKHTAPEWTRPSQLMCWLRAPRFTLTEDDYNLFGIETINRNLGGVYLGVNKAVGKHHWEVFQDEGRDSRVGELVTSTLRSQTEAAGDFDIEWANNPGAYEFQQRRLTDFKQWLIANGFDPEDQTLTIGHPQVGQIDLIESFGTTDYQKIWTLLNQHLNVWSIITSHAQTQYKYNWSDTDYQQQQIQALKGK